eukprot:5386023-Pyramimonas_sp.AAC.1
MQTSLESTDGRVRFPKKDSGLCLEADYDLPRLLPTKRSPTMPNATHIPPWFSQRRYGGAPLQGILCPWAMRHKKERCQLWGLGPQRTQSIYGVSFPITGSPGH